MRAAVSCNTGWINDVVRILQSRAGTFPASKIAHLHEFVFDSIQRQVGIGFHIHFA